MSEEVLFTFVLMSLFKSLVVLILFTYLQTEIIYILFKIIVFLLNTLAVLII